MKTRMKPADRKNAILEAAVTTATKIGFASLRLAHVAAAAQCSNALIVSHFSTVKQLRRDVMRKAIKDRTLPIIAAGIAIGDPTAVKVSPELRKAALASLA